MGYYDQPEPSEFIGSFTCLNDECKHFNEETDIQALDYTAWAVCEKCEQQSEWDVTPYEDYCHCGDHCRC